MAAPKVSSSTRAGWATCSPPGVVFALTAILVTNQAGLADSVLGVLGVMVASGLGFYALRDGAAAALRFALAAGAVLAASGLTQGVNGRLLHIERNFFGVVRVTEDAEANVHRLFHGSTSRPAEPRPEGSPASPRPISRDPGRSASSSRRSSRGSSRPGARVAIVGLGAGRWPPMPGPASAGRSTRSTPPSSGSPGTRGSSPTCATAGRSRVEVVLGDARLRLARGPRSCLSA